MKKAILLFSAVTIFCSLSLQAYHIETGSIAKYCEHGEFSDKQNTELAKLLNTAQDKYATFEARNNDRIGLVKTLDTIISKSSFAPILECRNKILHGGMPFSYELIFHNPDLGEQTMSLSYSAYPKLLLKFDLHKPIAVVLPVYLHELTHVCQAAEYIKVAQVVDAAQVYIKDPIQLQKVKKYLHLAYILNEVEAFKNMTIAYGEFVQHSKRMCDTPSRVTGQAYYIQYLSMEWMFENGMMAQSIVNDYKDTQGIQESSLFDAQSKAKVYSPLAPKESFSLKKLNPDLKKAIEALGIPVIE